MTQKPGLFRMEGISERTVREHWLLYERLVASANELRDRLQRAAPLDQPHFPALRRQLAETLVGLKQHAVYFSNLGGGGGQPGETFARLVERDFGSFRLWERDLKAAAYAAECWVFCVLDQDDGHLYNLADPVWEGSPLLALDVCEHAYLLDHGTNRVPYVEAYFANLDWADVEARAERALRRFRA